MKEPALTLTLAKMAITQSLQKFQWSEELIEFLEYQEARIKELEGDIELGDKKPDRIPITAAKNIAKKYNQEQVILTTWDGAGTTHSVTYGINKESCRQAAMGGDFVMKCLDAIKKKRGY